MSRALLLASLSALTAAPVQDSGVRGWVLAGFATAAVVAGVPLYVVVRRRRTTAAAEQVRDCAP
ncbi:hypothetical protein ABT063_43815 [Streptomyces sp. NPDC002838]|uniref:hypothetical protein n=1 Tax=Streptomyces sp. NPDC002838 TaxID=3154436 RepID=UPI003324780E